MMTLLKKEMKLTASPLSYLFLSFALMAFIPAYPILLCGFFICFGIFQSFQAGREASDILYTAMLPVEKADVVRAKYAFTVFIQLAGLVLLMVFTAIRMTVLSGAAVYRNNPLMNANLALPGYYLIVCACFNVCFVNAFFKTAYKIGIPFLTFGIAAFVVIMIAETLHFLPGCAGLNSTVFEAIQLIPLLAGIAVYASLTLFGLKMSIRRFEVIDL